MEKGRKAPIAVVETIREKDSSEYYIKMDASDLLSICAYQADTVLSVIKLLQGACFVNGKEKAELNEKLKEQIEFWGSLYNEIYYAEKGEEGS